MDKKIKDVVEQWLDATGNHFATHSGANYCYLNDNTFDYSRVSSYPVSIEDAWEDGTISILPDGNIQVTHIVLPQAWDTTKIRRRVEDALRKSADIGKLVKIAQIMQVNLA